MDSSTITKRIVLDFLNRYSDVNLDTFSSITGEALQLLVERSDWVIELNGLSDLHLREAERLSEHDGALFLNRLKQLSPGAAAYLRRCTGTLALNGLQQLSAETSEQLGLHSGNPLQLNGIKRLSSVAAEWLSRHQGPLELNGLLRISDGVAAALSKHQGSLSLTGLTSLSDAAAASLAQHDGLLNLNGITSLSDQAAASLSQHESVLQLDSLANVYKETSKTDEPTDYPGYLALADRLSPDEDIHVNCLTELSDHSAEKLSTYFNSVIQLNGLQHLSATAAEHLQKHVGKSAKGVRSL